jgi:hypothetical protein
MQDHGLKHISPQAAANLHGEIYGTIQRYARVIMVEWTKRVPQYFNRRSHGMHEVGGAKFYEMYKSGKKIPKGALLHRQGTFAPVAGRTHSGKLENALVITSSGYWGAKFYVEPCTAATDGRDYVEILIHGAHPDSTAPTYSPYHDARSYLNGEGWSGISYKYWEAFQHSILKTINIYETQLNEEILKKLIAHEVMDPSITYAPQQNIKTTIPVPPYIPPGLPNSPYNKKYGKP